ncbi:putative NADPH-dependent FMN reductase [Frankia canadensis]|uniref:Putative NADPH-dependent FMN reductase n=1 Tax=Frankia canadensis TaxID=1836972 RepID=A0A2I2KZS8_9ACTN|nr:NAD(P)H-dependent oxidoreductase [Frankia canadensis]SNQ51171.1 putative NADPH-dependent FMN reductase [Frankia canadensis]SOU58461.1 putative NADPH-dependent FMN reductase [Frankia canadensis]
MVVTRLLLISGSTRAASTNTAALRTVLALAPPDVEAVVHDGLADLPAFTPDADDSAPHPAVADLRTRLADADAVLLCTPEYAGALPGSLKNLLDWTVGTGDLYGKPAAWINVAAPGRGTGALAELRTVLGYVTAEIIGPACVDIPVPRDAVTPAGTIDDPAIRAALTASLTAVVTHLRGQTVDSASDA